MNSNSNDGEILFWKIIRNKVLFKKVLWCISCYIRECTDVKWLCDQGYKKVLQHKLMNREKLELNVAGKLEDDRMLERMFIKLFKLFKNEKDKELYIGIYQLSKQVIIKNRLELVIKSDNRSAFKILSPTLSKFQSWKYNENTLYRSILKRSFKIAKYIIYKDKHQLLPFNQDNQMRIMFALFIPISRDARLLDKAMNNQENQVDQDIDDDDGSNSDGENDSSSGENENKKVIVADILKIHDKVKKFIAFLGSKKIGYRSIYITLNWGISNMLFTFCPIAYNFTVKSVLNSCYAANSLISFTNDIDNSQLVYNEDNREKDTAYLNFTSKYLLSKTQLNQIKFQLSQSELKMKLSSLSIAQREKIKPLIRMYITYGQKSLIESAWTLRRREYWKYYGKQGDEFIEFHDIHKRMITICTYFFLVLIVVGILIGGFIFVKYTKLFYTFLKYRYFSN